MSNSIKIPLHFKFTEKISDLPIVILILAKHMNVNNNMYENGLLKIIVEYYIGIHIIFTPYSVKSILRFIDTHEIEIRRYIECILKTYNSVSLLVKYLNISFKYTIKYNFVDFIIYNTLSTLYKHESNIEDLENFVNILKKASTLTIYKDLKEFTYNMYYNKICVYNLNPSLYPYIGPMVHLMI